MAKLGVGAWSRLAGPKEDLRELVNCREREGSRESERERVEEEKEGGVSAAWSDPSSLERLNRSRLSPEYLDSGSRSGASHLRPQGGLSEKCQLFQGGTWLPGGQGKN